MYLGADPGATGALVVLDSEGKIIFKEVMPIIEKEIDLVELRRIIEVNKNCKAIVEKVSSMPKQGVSSVFKFGRSYGMLEAMIAAHAIPYELATPQAWQKVMHQGIEKKLKPKKRSLIAAKRIFPTETFLATARSKVPHDGLVDAALIAEYCRRKFLIGL